MKNGYITKHSYDNNFVRLMEDMEKKYSSKMLELCGIGSQLDINSMSKKFFTNTTTPADISVDANANVGDRSIIAYMYEVSKPYLLLNSYYRLWKWLCKNRSIEYANEIIEKQISGDIYINDLHSFAAGKCYCFNFSTYDTALNGIPKELDSKGSSYPPKYLISFKEQLILFCLLAGNSVAGAVGLADCLVVMSIYFQQVLDNRGDSHVKFESEKECWSYLKETLTSLVYVLNQPYRGNETLFTNISIFDKNFLKELCPSYTLELNGKIYNAQPELVDKIQKVFLNIMNRELKRRVLTYPITTACFSINENNEIQDEEFLNFISEQNLDFGFINIYAGKTSTISSCCRLQSDRDHQYFNSLGSGSTKVGSHSVVTLNLPRLAYKYKNNKEKFFEELKKLVINCQEINNAKRNIIRKVIKDGFAPLYSLGYMDLKRQYSTLGISGFYECLEIMGYDIVKQDGIEFSLEMLKLINNINEEMQNKFKSPHNVEQVPGENLGVKLADKDKFLRYNNKEYDIYSNQFIPLTVNANLLDRLMVQGKLDKNFSGGSIAHINIDQQIKDISTLKEFIRSAIKKGVVYHAINYILNKCECENIFVGNLNSCPKCGSDNIDQYSRVVGFIVKTKYYNRVRREIEFPNRVWYKVDNLL